MGKLGFVASALVIAIALASGCAHNNGAARDGSGGGDLVAVGDGGQGVPCRQQVLSGEVTNARGLDGVLLADGYKVACGTLFRGGDLSALGSAGCAEFATLGIKTVIDLRQASVQQDQPPAACVSSQAKLVSAAMPKLLPDTPDNYLALLQEKAAVATVFATLADAGAYPVYTHCVIGRDRASFVAALVLLALGADRQAVIDEFVLSEGAGVPVLVPCIEAVLDEIDKQGGIEAYLTSAGVTGDQLSALRAAARAK